MQSTFECRSGLVISGKSYETRLNEPRARLRSMCGVFVSAPMDIREPLVAHVHTTKRVVRCLFCKGEHHTVTTCKARKGWSALGQEHCLSSSTPDLSTLLCDRMRLSMPVRVSPHGEKVHTTLTKTRYGANLIIHEAAGINTTAVEEMNFCVSFLSVTGEVDSNLDKIWVGGYAMSGLLNHNNKKVKHVFDETVHMKSGWRIRQLMSQPAITQEEE